MKCKFCQGEMPDDGVFCPYCGKSNLEDPKETAQAVEELLEEEEEAVVLIGDDEAEEESDFEEAAASPQIKRMKLVAMISGCVAVLAVLATVLFFGIKGGSIDLKEIFWIREDSLTGNESYSVSDKKVANKRNDVVATLGDAKLTNGQLQIYYWMQVYDFVGEYGMYLSYLGMDYTQPLDEQICSFDKTMTWQQYFLQAALDTWHSNQALTMLAEENDYQLNAEYQKRLDEMRQSMEDSAQKNGFASADEMLQDEMGAGCTLDDYIAYMEAYYMGYLYFGELYDAIELTDADVDAYFEKNKAEFEKDQVTKESGKYYTIRHILIEVTGGTKGEDGNMVYTDEEWKTCQDKAQKLYDTWLAGEVNEDTFTALVADNSDDDNTVSSGGLYRNFTKDYMKKLFGEEYENWCIAVDRKAGDHALIKSEVGYHLVYFVESQDIWYTEARSALLAEKSSDMVKAVMDRFELDVNYKKIVLGVVELG